MKNKETKFRIAHISDLHFSEETSQLNPDHSHSIDHLRDLPNHLIQHDTDFLVVSGDVSNHGDKQSLINANSYLFDQLGIGEEEHIGLLWQTEKAGVIPGNHDAWNAKKSGRLFDRRQKALTNFNHAFTSHKVDSTGCYYRWIQQDNSGVFFAFVDSCFLGDTVDDSDSTFGTMKVEALAKGKLSIKQAEQLLEWHDMGINGKLPISPDNEKCIDEDIFSKSLKVIVMHHYLFEPPEHKSDFFMRVKHRDLVFRNIAFSDYDVLLCGHKHIADTNAYSYGSKFDARARNRYLLNYFRRLIGLHSEPIQLKDKHGNKFTKFLSTIFQYLSFSKSSEEAEIAAAANDVREELKNGILEPERLEKEIRRKLRKRKVNPNTLFEDKELRDIRRQIKIEFTKEERRKLNQVAQDVMNSVVEGLGSRSIYQIMSGSTAKSCCSEDRPRSFNTIDAINVKNDWEIRVNRHEWNWESKQWNKVAFETCHRFHR